MKCIEHKSRDCKNCGHYSIFALETLDDVKRIFPDGKCNTLNWFYASTSGVHGSYRTLDDLEKEWDDVDEESGKPYRDITVQILMPRMVAVMYGSIEIENKEDIQWLRNLVQSSLEAIRESQQGNLPSPTPVDPELKAQGLD